MAFIGERLDNITIPLWPPLSGVMIALKRQVGQAERVVERHHHAPAAPYLLKVDHELLILHER